MFVSIPVDSVHSALPPVPLPWPSPLVHSYRTVLPLQQCEAVSRTSCLELPARLPGTALTSTPGTRSCQPYDRQRSEPNALAPFASPTPHRESRINDTLVHYFKPPFRGPQTAGRFPRRWCTDAEPPEPTRPLRLHTPCPLPTGWVARRRTRPASSRRSCVAP